MKTCPSCNRTYADALQYCLDDGSTLIAFYDPDATLVSSPHPRVSPSQAGPNRQSKVIYLLIALIVVLLLGFGIVIVLLKSSNADSSSVGAPQNRPTESPKQGNTPERKEPSPVPTPSIRTYDLTLDAAHPYWTPTGINVQAGDRIDFIATGRIRWDANDQIPQVGPGGADYSPNSVRGSEQFLLRDAPCAALIGQIQNQAFLIGSERVKNADSAGELYLGINERWKPGTWDDNQGTFHVRIRVERQ